MYVAPVVIEEKILKQTTEVVTCRCQAHVRSPRAASDVLCSAFVILTYTKRRPHAKRPERSKTHPRSRATPGRRIVSIRPLRVGLSEFIPPQRRHQRGDLKDKDFRYAFTRSDVNQDRDFFPEGAGIANSKLPHPGPG